MPGTPTPNYSWPLPALADPPDGPAQMAALGNAADATVKGVDNRLVVVEQAPIGRFSKSAAAPQSIPNAAYTPISFPTKDEDPTAIANAGGTVFTIKKAGIWLITGCLVFAPNATGFRIFTVCVNGPQIAGSGAGPGGAFNMSLTVAATLRLLVGDVIEFQGYHNVGTALSTSSATPSWVSLLWQRS